MLIAFRCLGCPVDRIFRLLDWWLDFSWSRQWCYLVQELLLETIRDHFSSRAVCVSLAYFNNPLGNKIKFAIAAYWKKLSMKYFHLSIQYFKVSWQKTWDLCRNCRSFKTSRLKMSISAPLVAGVSWTAHGITIWWQKKYIFINYFCIRILLSHFQQL